MTLFLCFLEDVSHRAKSVTRASLASLLLNLATWAFVGCAGSPGMQPYSLLFQISGIISTASLSLSSLICTQDRYWTDCRS